MTEFEEIYRVYFGDVYRYVLSLCREEGLAEDITSEAFFKAMGAIAGFRGDCSIRVWLCQIAKNCYYTHLRKSRRPARDTDMEPASHAADSFEDMLADQSSAMEVHRALHALPEPYKEVFMLRVFSERSFAQIGQLFGKSANWACVTYHRAKTKLQSAIKEISP